MESKWQKLTIELLEPASTEADLILCPPPKGDSKPEVREDQRTIHHHYYHYPWYFSSNRRCTKDDDEATLSSDEGNTILLILATLMFTLLLGLGIKDSHSRVLDTRERIKEISRKVAFMWNMRLPSITERVDAKVENLIRCRKELLTLELEHNKASFNRDLMLIFFMISLICAPVCYIFMIFSTGISLMIMRFLFDATLLSIAITLSGAIYYYFHESRKLFEQQGVGLASMMKSLIREITLLKLHSL